MKGPDKMYGPLVANILQKMATEIQKETGATGVRITCEYLYDKGKGDMRLQTFTTPDAKTERLLDPDRPMPRGTKLQHDVLKKLNAVIQNTLKNMGGK